MDAHHQSLVRPTSWIDTDSKHPDFLTTHSLALPLSPYSRIPARAHLPAPTVSEIHLNSPDHATQTFSPMIAADHVALELTPENTSTATSPSQAVHFFSRAVLAGSVSETEPSFLSDSSPPRSFARPPKVPSIDPSHFPDPYPHRLPYTRTSDRLSSTLPSLSSASSSSPSTRSSAYTNSGSALATSDHGHVQIVSGEDEQVGIAVGIMSDDVARVLAGEGSTSSAGRTPIDQARWSEYSASIRSRSSSIGLSNTNSLHECGILRLRENPSFDMAWQTVDERDEAGLASGDETDDFGDDEDADESKGEERTSAIVIAEEGRGLIVKGDGIPIVQLKVEPGTTHLLVGSSSTPNSIPAFLTNTLPQICHSLLALDISANFLVALPPALASCGNLEELNVASNPLRVLPVFLSHLVALRVLIADATGIGTLSDSLAALDRLHTLSIRRNKMHFLPSWLCLLPLLQELYLDGNPFQGPWQALVGPLLSKAPATPLYPPSTPSIPLLSTSMPDSPAETETDTDSDPRSADPDASFVLPPEDDTITPARAPPLERSTTSPAILSPVLPVPDRSLVRTNTAPNRSYQPKPRSRTGTLFDNPKSLHRHPDESGYGTDHELRKMKSAGELRTSFERYRGLVEDLTITTPERPPILPYSGSASSSNLLSIAGESPESYRLVIPGRYSSLGVSALTPTRGFSRPTYSKGLFDVTWEGGETDAAESTRSSIISPPTSPPHPVQLQQAHGTPSPADRQGTTRGRWGFLKKMSMGKMRADPPTISRPNTSHGRTPRPEVIVGSVTIPSQLLRNTLPRIDVRFSTSGSLGQIPNSTPSVSLSPPINEEDLAVSADAPPPESTNAGKFLVPTSSPRASKRRSFLPVDGSAVPNLAIPSPTHSTGNLEMDEPAAGLRPSSAVDADDFVARREEERAREAYTRALRSVMAYLKDMNDLNLSQGTTLSMYGGSPEDSLSISRSRRPTVVEKANSEGTVSRAASISGQLRSPEAMAGLRSGTTSQTISVATTDSSGSSDERKYKDDKGKRALVIREIIETERTYVKGLQGLVDIYVKPSAAPVNLISGVGSGKETVIPASERKVVFSGIEALFSFHKESFLPALEAAAAPLMKRPPEGEELDADGQLSIEVTKGVAGIFLKHTAFMKMYSSYINNFDNSVQRIKYWTIDRAPAGNTSPGSALSPTSTGLSNTAISLPTPMSDSMANLTSGQRKRIKTFLKRCRVNPRHSQLNMEGYLLLPVQRIPRYRLLLEELIRSTPPTYSYMDDALDRALAEISLLANNMNEGKRESETRRKLVQWQSRIRGKFPSPLVQPHRRLIMDGQLMLTRVVRKTVVSFETVNAQGDVSAVQVDCLAPELTPRPLIGILCNDLLVLCRDPSEGRDPMSPVDLWAVLRMQTLPQPASIVHGNALRIVDNKAILYFDAPSPSEALNWFRAINLHIPSSKA
ncbi:hypothetical protein J3R82DRAFT_971 [Butyriboletus roseoflavus]|nr:hypothetical protein J3R82DRAFT_971 [Butyriboletus roseoflavus]